MGAALTYAPRYALFTLVGIAGEDDLDAPDITTPTSRPLGPDKPHRPTNSRRNGGGQHRPGRREAAIHRDAMAHPEPILGAETSTDLRDRLVAELGAVSTADAAAIWAQRCLVDKNRLTSSDAQQSRKPSERSWRALLEVPQTSLGIRTDRTLSGR